MRLHLLFVLLCVGMFAAGSVQAQTWANPLLLYHTASHQYSGDTCLQTDTIEFFEGFDSPGPDVVYRLNNLAVGRNPPHFGDTILYVYPTAYALDFEVLVCANESGNYAWNCPVAADNLSNGEQVVYAYIPAAFKTYHIIVTSGNLGYGSRCGPYVLDVQRLPQ
jgi:hypothetical protein